MGGAAAGKYTVKSCGQAHAWCAVCRPDTAEGQRRPKPPRKPGTKPCRNCGMCNDCIGLTAPEGMKVCRKCRETKPVGAFALRGRSSAPHQRRNDCMKCKNANLKMVPCAECGKRFLRHGEARKLCPKCRPPLTKPCKRCGAQFVGSMDSRAYCSTQCRDDELTEQRAAARLAERITSLRAYGGENPACVCCGVQGHFFLALDHIDGGGRKHRQETGGGGFYVWLRKNGYPAGFRVLCHNCNMARQFSGTGTCPHEAERQREAS